MACSGVTFTFTVLTSRGATLRYNQIRPVTDYLTLPNHDLYTNGEIFPYRVKNGQVENCINTVFKISDVNGSSYAPS